MVAPRRKKKSSKASKQQPVPCQYDCGRVAAGTLLVDFHPMGSDDDAFSYQRTFRVCIPCCRECLKGAIRVQLAIPNVEAKKG